MLEMLFYAILIGIASSIYRNILMYEDVLKWWVRIGQRNADKFYYKPIWGCDKCLAGQLAMWLYVLNAINSLNVIVLSDFISSIVPIVNIKQFNVLNGFILISISILTTVLTTRVINKR